VRQVGEAYPLAAAVLALAFLREGAACPLVFAVLALAFLRVGGAYPLGEDEAFRLVSDARASWSSLVVVVVVGELGISEALGVPEP